VITGVSTIASLGMLGVGHPLLAMGLFGLGTIAGLVPRFQHGVIADAFLEVERADPFFDLSELDRVRGVIASDPPVTPRARRYAIEGLFGGVRAADILGPSMILRSGDDVVEVAWDRARVHVDGPVRERGLRRAGVSPTQRRALWLEGHIKGRLRAIALHDGFEVEITGDVQVLSGTREEQVGYRSAPRRLVVRPHDGAMRVRVIKGEDVR
jgi:hypothetical protein